MQEVKRGIALWYTGLTFILVGILVGIAATLMPAADPVEAHGERFSTGIASMALWLIGVVMILVEVFRKKRVLRA